MPDSLLGRRSAELFLTDFLTSDSRGAAVVIAADPGMGASALLSRVAVLGARQQYRVFRAVGYRDEQRHEGTGLHQLLRPLRRRIAALPPAARAALTLGGPISALVEGALVLLADEASRNPVLLVVDDLHLFDATSVRALAELVERSPVVLVASARRHRADAVAPRGASRLTLEPLSPRDSALLLARQPSRPVGRGRLEVLRAAQGNPRAIVELSRIVSRSGAGNVRRLLPTDADALRQRFAGLVAELPPDVRRVVEYAATLTGAEPVSALTAALHEAGYVSPALDAAVEAGLLAVRDDDRLVFCDPLLQVATYNGLSFADRIRINRDFCAVLPPDSLEHALHRAAATVGTDDDAAAALERSGEREWSQGRPFVSTVAFQWAADLATDPARSVRLRIRAIKSAGALGQTTWMGELAAVLRSPDLPAELHYEVALALSRAGRQREAMDRVLEAFHHGSPRHRADGLLLAAAAGTIANASGLERHTTEIPELVRRASALPDTPVPEGHPLASLDRSVLNFALSSAGEPVPPPVVAAGGESVTGTLLLAYAVDAAGDPRAAVGLRLSALERMRADGTIGAAPEMWLPLISDLLDLGRWTEAADLLTEAEDAGVRTDLPLLRLELTALRALLAGLRGDATQARTLAESVWSVLDLDENRRLRAQLIRALGLAALGRGEYDSAYRYFRRLFDQQGHPMRGGRALLELAVAAVPAGEAADASAVLAANRSATGARHRAVVHLVTALLTDDEANFRAAVDTPGATVWVVDHALARYHYGVWLRRQRRYRDARAQLKAALATFESVGIDGSAAMARTELQAAGDEGDDVDESPALLADLSPQQRQVVTMAAQGLRNKEIAARLLLSPRTVGTHLYNAYMKLGIGTRAELRVVLGRRTA